MSLKKILAAPPQPAKMRVGLTKNFKGKLHDLMIVNSIRFATFTIIELEHLKCFSAMLCTYRFCHFQKNSTKMYQLCPGMSSATLLPTVHFLEQAFAGADFSTEKFSLSSYQVYSHHKKLPLTDGNNPKHLVYNPFL